METIEAIRIRRSIRKFTDQNLSDEQINLLKEAVLRSPSSRNRNPWKFWFVQSPALIKELAKSKTNGSQLLNGAKLAVVIGGDETVSDCWIEDCSIAAIFLQIAAVDLGLGSCWVQIRNREAQNEPSEDFIRNLLNIEKNMRIGSIIAVGHPAEICVPLKFDDLDFTKITELK